MVLEQLMFLAKIRLERNRIPRRLIPKLRIAIKSFPDKHPKIFVRYGRLAIPDLSSGWFNTINWIVEHYYVIQDAPITSLGTFSDMALRLTESENRYWVTVKGYNRDGFWIPPHRNAANVDHAVIFVDGVIALKVESRDGKYFIADYFIGNMFWRNASDIIELWRHERIRP